MTLYEPAAPPPRGRAVTRASQVRANIASDAETGALHNEL